MSTINDRVLSDMHALLDEEMSMLQDTLQDVCESPIEVALGVSLLIAWRLQGESYALMCPLGLWIDNYDPTAPYAKSYGAVLVPQFVRNNARHDFAIFHPLLTFPIIIECDGHEFHERTKQQAKKDRSRDRSVQSRGSAILRFTGSEIYASPKLVGEEILNFVSIALVHGR